LGAAKQSHAARRRVPFSRQRKGRWESKEIMEMVEVWTDEEETA
jgi:hypothetical protein